MEILKYSEKDLVVGVDAVLFNLAQTRGALAPDCHRGGATRSHISDECVLALLGISRDPLRLS